MSATESPYLPLTGVDFVDRPTPSDIVVVVVPRDRFSTFRMCLDALYAHTHTPFRVIVVAGGADNMTREFLHRFQLQKGNVTVVLEDHLLKQGEARNIALAQATERFCVVLENDTIVHDNWLVPLLECMCEERAAAVMPLIFWHRGLHAAGCTFEERIKDDAIELHHTILYTGIHRKRIDYPECHCLLIDRHQFPEGDVFDDVEPFDVDLGLTLRKHGRSAFLEPRSVATYSAPPPCEVRDVPPYKFRWDPSTWEARNREFMRKWGVRYNPSSKIASYRRQQLKLGLARWYPNKFTIFISNASTFLINALVSFARRERNPRPPA